MNILLTESKRSFLKSATTRPLPEGTCNMPVNVPEAVREEIDALRLRSGSGNGSRNTFLVSALVVGIRRFCGPTARRIEGVLQQCGRPMLGWFRREEKDVDVSGERFDSPV